ncbi:Uncharacterised protein [Mycobacteroides abscessus]|nr:Uncharacterised protein [Mycobacteroides abscessus]
MSMLSSRPVRECTIASPSTAMSAPATIPIAVEANSRRAIRATSTTATTPTTADAIRHDHGFSAPPSAFMPSAIIHLPSGGWTT